MKNEYKKILDLYEEFKLHKGDLGKDGFFDFQAPDSYHSPVTCFAYGIRETRSCLNIRRDHCVSEIELDGSLLLRRFYVKLKACLFDWKTYICGIAVTVNGKKAYENDREFFENVNIGWPTIYIPIDSSLLRAGKNHIKIEETSGESDLLVTSVDLLSLPAPALGDQLTLRTAARVGDSLSLAFFTEGKDIAVIKTTDCDITEILPSPLNKEHSIVSFKITGFTPLLSISIGGKEITAVMPEVFAASEDRVMVGTDSDDHRHDDSDETNRIIEIFTNTELGNFWQARPQHERNHFDLSSPEVWKDRIDHLKAFDTKISLADSGKVMQYLPELCGDSFVGCHFHEAYLYFCSALLYSESMTKLLRIDVDGLLGSESFGDTKKLFCEALKDMYEDCRANAGLTSVGSPSLLVSYEATSGFERITIEPVSNILLLIGGVRGAKPNMWGAHVPSDWYFGEPNDTTKAKKFLLAMQLLYINGAEYIYAENSLFKTNAFSREDWEDEYCVLFRKYQREFYEYTIKNPREGELRTKLGVIYGNNEFFLWHHDDRIAELPENDNWDITLWGKWKDNSHHKCWRAIDAWMPVAEDQHSKKNLLNLDIFSGTPYGSVDIVPYASDYSEYDTLALLGWNTYEEGFTEKLIDYVSGGGTAFVSYCHFNKTDRNDLPMEYADISPLGMTCLETFETSDGFSVARLDASDCEAVACDSAGIPLVIKKAIGSGTLYFGTFADYRCPDSKMAVLKAVLKRMGEETAFVRCTEPSIAFTHRVLNDGTNAIDLVCASANSTSPVNYELIFADGRRLAGKAAPCEIVHIEVQ